MQLKTLLDQLRVDLVWKGVWAMKFFNEEGYRSFVTKYQECLFENTYGVEFNDANKVKVYGKEFIGWANPDKADDSVWEDAKDSFVKSPNLATPVRETHDLREEFEEAANEGNIRMLEKQIPAIRSHIKGRINKEFRDWLVDIRILFVVEVLMNLSCIFKDLVPESILPDEFLCAIKYSDYNSATTKINLAVDHLPQFKCCKLGHPDSGPQHVGTIHIGSESMEDIDFACQEVVNGSPSRRPIIEMTIPSVLDKTISPPGKHVINLFIQYTPYKPFEGSWEDPAYRESFAQRCFTLIDEYAPGFSSSIIGYDMLTPPDLEREIGLTGGNIFHGVMGLDSLFLMRPVKGWSNYRTPVRGLYLCGSGAHPGGGVMGAPGRNSARVVIQDLKSL